MMGTVASTLTRDECRRYASHRWNDAWDEFYFEADGKTVARDVAEMVLNFLRACNFYSGAGIIKM